MSTVLRVCWLREKDRAERWKEEVVLCKTDLACSRRYFTYKKEQWKKWEENSKKRGKRGHRCYAAKQAAVWGRLEERAQGAISEISKVLQEAKLKF